jgi:hypothetical protein
MTKKKGRNLSIPALLFCFCRPVCRYFALMLNNPTAVSLMCHWKAFHNTYFEFHTAVALVMSILLMSKSS